jgi:hypothetical protein
MSLRNPFAVYTAASNLEAHVLCGLLADSGIEAAVVEDVSQMGTWIGGIASQLHIPKVWIERTDIERAKPILEEYERRASERRALERQNDTSAGGALLVTCDECGAQTSFPAAQKGSVRNCPKCGAFVDVGDDGEEFEEVDETDESP